MTYQDGAPIPHIHWHWSDAQETGCGCAKEAGMTAEERAVQVGAFAKHVKDMDMTFEALVIAMALRQIREAVAQEREACARIASDMADNILGLGGLPGAMACQKASFGRDIFAAIRARGGVAGPSAGGAPASGPPPERGSGSSGA